MKQIVKAHNNFAAKILPKKGGDDFLLQWHTKNIDRLEAVAGRGVVSCAAVCGYRDGSLREGAPAQQVEEYASYRENACKKVSRVVTSGIFKVTQTPSVAQMRATFLSEEGFLCLRIGCKDVCGSGIAGDQ